MIIFAIFCLICLTYLFLNTKIEDVSERYSAKINILENKIDELIKTIEQKQDINNSHYTENIKTTEENNIIENEISQIESSKLNYCENNEVTKNAAQFNFENIFLGNIFNKIGAIAIIIGLCLFIKLISPYIVFTPLIKITMGYIISILMLFGGLKLKEEKIKAYKETILGTSVSTAFITTYCAYTMFKIFSPLTAILISSLILCGVFFLADKQKSLSMIIIALIAGYITPFLTTQASNVNFFLCYFIFINLLSLIYTYKNPNYSNINLINLCLTCIITIIYTLVNSANINIFIPIILWSIYIIYDILRPNKDKGYFDKNNLLCYLNFAILTLLSIVIFINESFTAIGFLLLFSSLLYFALAYYHKKQNNCYNPYIYSGVIGIYLGTFFLTDETTRVAYWSIEGLILSFIAHKYKINYMFNFSLGFILSATIRLFFIDNVVNTYNYDEYKPILNIRTLNFLFPILASFLSEKLLLKSSNTKYQNKGYIFKFISLSLIYLFVTFELTTYIQKITDKRIDKNYFTLMCSSIIGFKYSIQMKKIYEMTKFNLFNIFAYLVGGFSLLKLLGGLEYKPLALYIPILNIRFAAFLSSIIAASFFARLAKSNIYKYLAITLGFLTIHIETTDFISGHNAYLVSLMWLLYTCIITLIGIFKNKNVLKTAGIILGLLTISRIFILDLAETDLLYKLIAFFALGIILLIISYFYNKKSKQ